MILECEALVEIPLLRTELVLQYFAPAINISLLPE